MDAARYQRFVSLLREAKPPDIERMTVVTVPEMPGVIAVHVWRSGRRHAIQAVTEELIDQATSLPAVVAEVWRRLSGPGQ